MLASGVVVLATLIGAPGGTELEAGATVEMRVGETPTGTKTVGRDLAGRNIIGPDEQAQVLAAVTPLLGLRWTGLGEELRLQSGTRILWRPVPLWNQRPLVLETFEATETARPTRRTGVRLSMRTTYGEEDYTSLVRQFGNQPLLPLAPTLFSTTVAGDTSWLASRRTTLLMGINAIYRRPFNQGAPATATSTNTSTSTNTDTNSSTKASTAQAVSGVPIMPTQATLTLIPTVRHRVDRRTQVEVLAAIADTDIQNLQLLTTSTSSTTIVTWVPPTTSAGVSPPNAHVNIVTLQPQVGLVRDLNRGSQVRLYDGLTYAAVLINSQNIVRDWLPLTPLGRAELSSLLWRTRESVVRSTFAASTSWFPDAALGIAVFRGTAEARLEAQLGMNWIATARGSFTTDLNKPLLSATTATFYDETIAQVDVPLRYLWSPQTVIEFGGRWAERGPNLRADNFAWRNRELWAFLLITGTTHQVPRAQTPRVRP